MSDADFHILVVDDNEMNRDMLSRRLKRLRYAVMIAESGEKALEMVDNHPFDLVLLDIMMPGMSGYDVLAQMKANAATQHIPIIMISAVDDLDSVVKCIEMGAEDYLFKPFNPVLLKARVQASLSRQQRHKSSAVMPYFEELQMSIAEIVDAGGLDEAQLGRLHQLQQRLNAMISGLNSPVN